jgi:peptide/nickel transport system permease protein
VVGITCATSVLLGVPAGLAAGYLGRATDAVIATATDLVLVVPSIVVALIITSVIGLSPVSAGVVLGLYGAGTYAVQTRSLTRAVKGRDHVRAEILMGTPLPVILSRQILPEIAPPLLHYLGSTAAGAILAFAGLAFIGLGVDTTVTDWGTMLYQYRTQTDHPILLLAPTVAIMILAGAIHIVCDAPGSRQ